MRSNFSLSESTLVFFFNVRGTCRKLKKWIKHLPLRRTGFCSDSALPKQTRYQTSAAVNISLFEHFIWGTIIFLQIFFQSTQRWRSANIHSRILGLCKAQIKWHVMALSCTKRCRRISQSCITVLRHNAKAVLSCKYSRWLYSELLCFPATSHRFATQIIEQAFYLDDDNDDNKNVTELIYCIRSYSRITDSSYITV